MKVVWCACISMILMACQGNTQEKVQLKTTNDSVSYAIGVDIGKNLKRQSIEITPAVLAAGIRDAADSTKMLLTEEHPRLHCGVPGQVEVEPVGPRHHQRLQPRRALGIDGLHGIRIDEQLHAQVAVDGALALGFCRASLRRDEVGLDPVEVVLGLRIDHAEHGIRVGFSLDVRNAPVVAGDRDAAGLRLPARHLGRRLRLGGSGDEDQREYGKQLLHFMTLRLEERQMARIGGS